MIGRDLPDLVEMPLENGMIAARGSETQPPENLAIGPRGGYSPACFLLVISRHKCESSSLRRQDVSGYSAVG